MCSVGYTEGYAICSKNHDATFNASGWRVNVVHTYLPSTVDSWLLNMRSNNRQHFEKLSVHWSLRNKIMALVFELWSTEIEIACLGWKLSLLVTPVLLDDIPFHWTWQKKMKRLIWNGNLLHSGDGLDITAVRFYDITYQPRMSPPSW